MDIENNGRNERAGIEHIRLRAYVRRRSIEKTPLPRQLDNIISNSTKAPPPENPLSKMKSITEVTFYVALALALLGTSTLPISSSRSVSRLATEAIAANTCDLKETRTSSNDVNLTSAATPTRGSAALMPALASCAQVLVKDSSAHLVSRSLRLLARRRPS